MKNKIFEKLSNIMNYVSLYFFIFLNEAHKKTREYGIRWYHLICMLMGLILLFNLEFKYSLITNYDSDKQYAQFSYVPDVPQKEAKIVKVEKKVSKKKAPKKEDEKLGENSEFAPSDPDKLDKLTTEQYIKKYKHIAISEMKRTKVPASITMAQAIIESACGNSRLARQINNHFGIKCHSRTCKKGHCMNYSDDTHKDFFRKFKTAEESYVAHSAVVLNKRYTSLLRGRTDYKSWAHALQNGGYATGKKYAAKLIRVIEMYGLDKLDK
jgi:flagellum-specific peptidoglycan hydrolase FlgJ